MSTPRHPTPDAFAVTADGGAGLTYKQTRARGFATPSPGVRQRTETVGQPLADARAAITACPTGVITDVSAARLWDLPLPRRIAENAERVSVAVMPDGSRSQRRSVRGRRLVLPSFHVCELDGLLVTTPVRTWLDCSPSLDRPALVAMGDAILHRGLGTSGEFQHLLTWGYRRRGMTGVRRAVPILDGGAESPAESWVRVLLIDAGLPAPECNVDIHAAGRWLARVDMVWRQQRVIVEYDGMVHLDERQRRRDAERLNDLQAAGWRVIVLTADDLRRPDRIVTLVTSALTR